MTVHCLRPRISLQRVHNRPRSFALASFFGNNYNPLVFVDRSPTTAILPRSMVPTSAFVSSLTTPKLQSAASSSPFDPSRHGSISSSSSSRKKLREFVPRKAAVQLTEQARQFFRSLLQNPPRDNIVGIMLNYHQSQSGEPRMVFSFTFVTDQDIDPSLDEGVSLEIVEEPQPDGSIRTVPKSPKDAKHDGLPKLYVSHNAFLKVLGATVDIEPNSVTPILYDREGNRMDPNA